MDTVEFYYRDYYRNRNLIFSGCTCNQDCDTSPEVISSFTDLNSALVELRKYKTKIRGGLSNHRMNYFHITEYYVE
jgi:hypothetical protein